MDQDLQLYKIVVIGNSGTGKSNISSRYMKDEFIQGYKASVGVQFFSKTMPINNKQVKVTLWDTAGQQRFKSICKVYYKGARGIIVVYDITDPQSYVDVESWLRLANDAVKIQDITVFIVGNKSDLQLNRKIPFQRVEKEYKQQFDVDCWEISAKTGHNVKQMFNSMIDSTLSSIIEIYQKGTQVKSSVFYGDSQLVTYSDIDRDSLPFQKKKPQRQLQPIGDVIIQEQEQVSKVQHLQPIGSQCIILDFQSKITLTNYEEMKRIEESKQKKKCCR